MLEKRRTTDVMLEYIDKGETLADFISNSMSEYRRLAEKCKRSIRSTFDY